MSVYTNFLTSVYKQDAKANEIEDVLILSGDHLYRMDYIDFIQVYYIIQKNVDVLKILLKFIIMLMSASFYM